MLRQVVEASEYATSDIELRYQAIKVSIKYINSVQLDNLNHIEIGSAIHRIVRMVTKNADPYLKLKEASNSAALEYLTRLERGGENLSFEEAVSYAILGNSIDYGAIKTQSNWSSTDRNPDANSNTIGHSRFPNARTIGDPHPDEPSDTSPWYTHSGTIPTAAEHGYKSTIPTANNKYAGSYPPYPEPT